MTPVLSFISNSFLILTKIPAPTGSSFAQGQFREGVWGSQRYLHKSIERLHNYKELAPC